MARVSLCPMKFPKRAAGSHNSLRYCYFYIHVYFGVPVLSVSQNPEHLDPDTQSCYAARGAWCSGFAYLANPGPLQR